MVKLGGRKYGNWQYLLPYIYYKRTLSKPLIHKAFRIEIASRSAIISIIIASNEDFSCNYLLLVV
jgi:hypothetical protein